MNETEVRRLLREPQYATYATALRAMLINWLLEFGSSPAGFSDFSSQRWYTDYSAQLKPLRLKGGYLDVGTCFFESADGGWCISQAGLDFIREEQVSIDKSAVGEYAAQQPEEREVYMLDVSEQDSRWRVFKVGFDFASDSYIEQWRKLYAEFGDMPIKTQETVAVLSMCSNGESIQGIGQKVSSTTYWLDDNPDLLEEYENE